MEEARRDALELSMRNAAADNLTRPSGIDLPEALQMRPVDGPGADTPLVRSDVEIGRGSPLISPRNNEMESSEVNVSSTRDAADADSIGGIEATRPVFDEGMMDQERVQQLLQSRILGSRAPKTWPPQLEISPPPRILPGNPRPIPRPNLPPNFDWKLPPALNIRLPPTPSTVAADVPPDPLALLIAYADALRPFLTLETDLSRSKQKLFIASPMQFGIPTAFDPAEFMNDALFKIADGVQSSDSPFFRLGGPSYFEILSSYADQVDASIIGSLMTESEAALRRFLIEEARGKLQKAKETVKLELNAVLDQFERIHRNDQTLLFDNWLASRAGDDYREALLEKDKASSVLKNLEGTQQEDLARVRDILDSARTVDNFKEGNNMPCALRDVDIDRTIENSQSAPQPGVVFRPSYFMSGYWNTSERWVRENATASPTARTVVIDPLESKRLKWSDFGFPELDTASPSRKADLAKIFGNGRMTLKCAGIAAFDVFRGIWNIDGFRTVLPPLNKDAPKELGQKICKTTKLLLAYDVEVVLELEKTLVSGLGERNLPIFPDVFGGIPFSIGEEVEGKVVLRAGLPRANAYPVLLAVLADVV